MPAATSAFERAVEMDPQLVDGWIMLARIRDVHGDEDGVRATPETAISSNPENQQLKQALAELQ